MKYVITPVGTSLFTNFADASAGSSRVERNLKHLRSRRAVDWDDCASYVDAVRKDQRFAQWIRSGSGVSAELESVAKITAGTEADHTVQLLATDTVLSRLAAELISDHEDVPNAMFRFNPEHDVIGDLQVRDAKDFGSGVRNLVRRIQHVIDQHGSGQCLINITGGYKATLPYLTIMGQVHDVPLHYKFEEADGVITIPQAPLSIDWELFETHETQFKALAEGIDDWPSFRTEYYTFCQRADSCIEVADSIAMLSPLGEVFWQRYTNRYFLFYAPDDVYEEINEELSDIRRILATKGSYLVDNQKVEQKNGHYVYDDGKNNNRIYFFRDGEDLYIYRAFEDHDAALEYIGQPIDKNIRNEIKQVSKLRRIEKQEN